MAVQKIGGCRPAPYRQAYPPLDVQQRRPAGNGIADYANESAPKAAWTFLTAVSHAALPII
ncbi:hypothetical protein [Paenibacillus macerans]|uniref:hypothetical protein n=1 Tax=Paenibacillus macerans TaxID=44252 RepID=UPI003D31B959